MDTIKTDLEPRLDCPSQETLSQIVLGTVDDLKLLESVDTHLQSCAQCRQLLNELSDSAVLKPFHAGGVYADEDKKYRFLDAPLRDGDLGAVNGLPIESEIGRGGSGIVFQGFEPDLGRRIAIKVLNNDGHIRSEARFERETKIAAKIRSDFVVSVHSAGKTSDDRPYLVMPLIVGESLKELLGRKALSESRSAEIVKQISTGLQSLHDAGIIHRDIKPANILIDDLDSRAKLTDFGLARDTFSDATLTDANILCGTPEYMSPEQTKGLDVDITSDIYSLGVTLYECLTGTTPFRGKILTVLQKHSDAEPVSPRRLNPDVSIDLETVCLKAIAKEPGKRYSTAEELAADLDRYLVGKPVQARPVSSYEKLMSWSRRNRLLSTSLMLLGITLVVSTVVTTLLSINSNRNAALAADRAQSLQEQTDELIKTTESLLDSNGKLRSALDAFFGRFVSDEAFRMQLSTTFRNEMVQQMLDYYSNYLELQVEDDELTLDVCQRIATVTDHLLDTGFNIQADRAIIWNLDKLQSMIESSEPNPDALSLLAHVQLQASEILSYNIHKNDYSDCAERALSNAELAIEIDKSNVSAQRYRLMAKARLLRENSEMDADDKRAEFDAVVSQLDELSLSHPENIGLYSERARVRNWMGKYVAAKEKAALRIESIEILQQLRNIQKQQGLPAHRISRNIAVGTFYLGMAQLQLNEQKQAEASLQSAEEQLRNQISRTPAYIQIRMDLAEVLARFGHFKLQMNEQEQAIDFFKAAIVEFKQVSAMEDGQSNAIIRRSQTNKVIALQLLKSEQTQSAGQYVHRAVDAYRSLFSQDANYFGPRHFQEFEKLLIFAADHFEQNGDASASSKYRQEAVKLRQENAKEFR